MTATTAPSSWSETSVRGCLADEFPGAWGRESGREGPNARILRSTNLDDDGHINFATAANRWIDEPHLTQRRLRNGDVLLEASGGGPEKPVGRVAHFRAPDSRTYLCSNFFRTLRPDERKVHPPFLAWRLLDLYRQPRIWNFQQQTTGIINLNTKDYLDQRFRLPEKDEQSRIAAVLDAVDEAIAKTEAVIAKLRQVRAGLLHDLLTRGLDQNGQLRDSIAHPEQFQDSPLGRIPREWNVVRISDEADIQHGYAFDGRGFTDKPLGPRLLVPGNFHRDGGLYFTDENTKYYVGGYSPETILSTGDMLIVMTDLSPMTLILGRTVLLNERFAVLHNQRIGKFRLKRPADWNPAFFVALMNDERVRRKVIREATGTTVRHTSPDRIRSGFALRPKFDEQEEIVARLRKMDSAISTTINESAKLTCLKSGLMTDLLTGHVRVPEINTKAKL